MIIREWRGHAAKDNTDAYITHFRTVVIPDLRAVDGFLGCDLTLRDLDDRAEFLVLTRWSSMDAIRAFAAEPIDRAVVEPGAIAALIDFDHTVQHYEVIESI